MDDHDLRDDWNTSQAWREQMARLPWWRQRVIGALGSYWIYQHLGNLSASERAEDTLLNALRSTDDDGGVLLDEFAEQSYEQPTGTKFSYVRDFGQTRFVMLDSRCGRLLTPGERAMMDEAKWRWFVEQVTGQYKHLVIGTSLPYLLPAGLHYLEAWNEAICDGAWGDRAARVGEKLRQGIDLEHWGGVSPLVRGDCTPADRSGGGALRRPPASVGFLSGDVHYSYLARALLPAAAAGSAPNVYQVVCSPIRNPLSWPVRVLNACASFVAAGLVGRALAKTARVPRSPFDWTVSSGPYFRNVLSVLEIDGERVDIRWMAPSASTDDPPPLQKISIQRIR